MCLFCCVRARRRRKAKKDIGKSTEALAKAGPEDQKQHEEEDGVQETSLTENGGAKTKNGDTTDDGKSYGILIYKLDYDFNQTTLSASIIRAENIPVADISGTSDPYVKVFLNSNPKNKFETKIKRKTLCPVFNETFQFQVPFADLPRETITFAIYDFDRMKMDDRLGQLEIPLNTVDFGAVCSEEKRPFLAPTDDGNTQARLGDICFSLRYNPKTGKLTVTILEARNLKKMDISGYSDPYVLIELCLAGKRLKKRKTTIKLQTLNPYYNESFQFKVPQEEMQQVYLALSVWDYDKLSRNDFIGEVILGSAASGALLSSPLAQRHWNEILASRRPVAHWHTLQAESEAPPLGCIPF